MLINITIGAIVTFIMIIIEMFLAYIGGSIFDSIMGTNVTPIFVIAGVLGYSSLNQHVKTDFWGKLEHAFNYFYMIPIVAIGIATIGDLFFAEIATTFMAMIQYDGSSIYSLALWGSITGVIIKFVSSIPIFYIEAWLDI
jgi:hypothetical protein